MSVQDGKSLLNKALKDLMFRWADTKSQWKDVMAENFEKNRLGPLEMDLRSASGAMDNMAAILSKVRRDCE